jgi:hypothetical protein
MTSWMIMTSCSRTATATPIRRQLLMMCCNSYSLSIGCDVLYVVRVHWGSSVLAFAAGSLPPHGGMHVLLAYPILHFPLSLMMAQHLLYTSFCKSKDVDYAG